MNTKHPSHDAGGSLRILQVLEPSGGGSGRHFLDLCRGLKARGHHVEAVFSPVRAEEGFLRELKSLHLPALHSVSMQRAPGWSDIAAFRALRRIIGNGGFDIVHGHSSKAGALTRPRLPGRSVPRVYTPHAFRTMDPSLGRMGKLIYGSIETILANLFTDHLICVSADEYDHARALGIGSKTMSTIVNGVTPLPLEMAQTVRASFGISPETFVFGFVGRLSHQKAPERLIEAFSTAASRLPDAHLIIVGSGERERAVRAAIEESGLKNRIRLTSAFTGSQAIPAFDALVMSSRYEAMSYVMLEAAAAGKPIVTTDVGGASSVVEAGKTGLIVANDGDTGKLARAMVDSADPARHSAMTAAAQARMALFSADIMVAKTETLYRQLVSRR